MTKIHSSDLPYENLTILYRSEYCTWFNARKRCTDLSSDVWENYGGRGIKMCERWSQSFRCFLLDMGTKPEKGYELDRFPDNNGNYELSNCRWATCKEQQRNRRSNKLVTYNRETHCISEWCEILGLNRKLVEQRLRKGWSIEESFYDPPAKGKANHRTQKKFTHNGVTLTIKQWSERTGVPRKLIDSRVRSMRWDLERAIFTPVKKYRPYKFKKQKE